MKSKCSSILKASTALVLALLMLFGTVTTSFAAVANDSAAASDEEGFFPLLRKSVNLAETGKIGNIAETGTNNFTVYLVPAKVWNDYTSGDKIWIRHKPDSSGWNLTKTEITTKYAKTYDGEDVYSCTAYSDGGTDGKGVNNIEFAKGTDPDVNTNNLWTGFSGWDTNGKSTYEGKVYDGTNWNAAVWDSTTTIYVKKSLIDTDGWTNIYLYNEHNVNSAGWPGVSTSGWTSYGDYYKYELTKPWNKLLVILNKGQGGDQTGNMSSGVNMGNSYIIDSAKKNTGLTLTQGTPVIAPSIELSTNKSTIVMDGCTASETATITTTISNSSATASYTVTKDGSAATSGTHYTLSNGVFTPKTTGTFVITGSITDGGTHTDSVTITSVARSVSFKTNTTGGTSTKGLTGNAMTYDSTLSTSGKAIYKYSKSLTAGNNYIVIYDSGDDKNLSYNNGTLSQTLLTSSGYTIYDGDNNVNNPLKVNASPAGTYNFYFDANNNKLYVEFPHTVTFNSKGGSSVSSQVVTYGGKATKPSDPSKEGYDFDTWVTTDGGSTAFNFTNTTITADTTVYAKWTAQNLTLTVDAYAKESSSGDYTVAATAITNQLKIAGVTQTSASVAVGSSVTVAAPATDPTGYVFVGWYDGTTQKSTSRSYTYTMATTAKTLTARYDRKYTLTINNKTSNGTLGATSKTVFYNDAPGSFTVTPSAGYQFDSANSTNLSTYYTAPSATSGTLTMTGKAASSITDSNKVNKTIQIAYSQITYPVQITAFKMDDTAAGYVPFSSGTPTPTVSTTVTNNTIPYSSSTVTVTKNSTTPSGYTFVGWYYTNNVSSNVTSIPADYSYSGTGNTKTFTPNGTAGSTYYRVIALYRKNYYITLYDSYMRESSADDWQFVAAPPRTVKVGAAPTVTGGTTRATYTYAAGTAAQRGEENVKSATGTYYEGNKLLVLAGEKVLLVYSTLASSDAIRGIFYNNARRYTTETEYDNLYYLRATKSGGGVWTSTDLPSGAVADDDWEYDYMANTTLRADPDYYDTATAPYSNITSQQSSYVATINQTDHTVSWTATSDYLNIDLELDYKYQLHINGDDWEGLKIENMNDEGYYFGGETFANNFKISIDNTNVTSGTYSFSGTTATVKDKDGNVISSGITVSPKQSNGTAATSVSNLSYFLVSGTMPHKNAYIEIPAKKEYKMRLANIVVSDNGTNKRTMLTETSGSATSSTGQIGTITAIPKTGTTTGSDISSDGNYETYPGNNNSGEVSIYTSGSNTNNKYLKGGVNKDGSDVEAGSTVTYTFTFASGKDAEYTFVGWFEGDKNGDTFTPNYNKKLSGKQSFTYTPTKDAVIFAVGTRDVYIGGNFTKDGAYTATSSSQTWASNRILMDFDPTYTNPNDSTKKGRYVYKFESVTANTEYQFRCYDTASGSQFADLTVWNTWITSSNGGSTGYNTDSTDISMYRDKYDAGSGNGWTSHGGFMYTTATDQKITAAREQGGPEIGQTHNISANHQANGYAAPVEVYFYAYDGGITVNSTYQWSRAYVSEGRGIDVLDPSKDDEASGKYNAPTASVANKTVNNKDVVVTTESTKYGAEKDKNNKTINKYEKIYECLVKENNGQIKVTAQSNDANVELQAFLVYNIDTKKSEAVKTFTSTGSGASKSWTGNITIPNNSKIYVVPIYKFTDDYITAQNLETHNVYVRAEDIDKDDWGGLVSMYSWGTTAGYNSGGWPGQLMIPSDDGQSFYAPLTFMKNGLAGVTFTNYTKVWGGKYVNFLGTYQEKGVSDTVYSGYSNTSTHYIYQAFDYREPISIIQNINETNPRIYDSEDMTLTFALKPGNKTAATIGNGAYNASFDYEYLTDSSGKYRVDLNGNKLSTNSTATYYVVCNYTEAYKSGGTKTYGFAPTTHNMYSIDWNVYDATGASVTNGVQLSASFTDIDKGEMLTYIAKQMIDAGLPVSGKAVKIAYENPKVSSSDNTEAVRYSGQWYADTINTLIEGNVRVGIYADGAWLPSDSNAPGYATATVEFSPNTSIGEGYVTEDGCTGNSLAKVTKIHAANGDVTFRVSTTTNFLGWYRSDGKGGYEPIGSNYKNQAVSLSFNEDMTYYAFYTASATYRFQYTGRDGLTKYYTAQGTSLTEAEMSAGGTLNPSSRSSDISSKLAKISDITVFNRTLTYALTTPDTSAPYTITYAAGNSENTYTLTVWSYNSSGSLVQKGSVTGTWSTALDVTNNASLGNGKSLVDYKPSGQSNNVFVGWKKKGDTSNTIISTQANFGYSITQDMAIEPVFGAARVTDESWQAGIDKNVITQELTDASTGTIYNDSLVSFKCKKATGEILDPSENECGLIILSQTGASSGNSTYSDNFDSISASKMQGYITTLRGNNQTAAKLKATTYGDAYALIVTADSLSRLNRADLYQNLDYSTFTNGKYKVMTYVKVGGTYSYSEPIEAVYTNGQKFPTV